MLFRSMWVLLKGLTCALLGGLGSIRGVLGGAVLLAVTESYAQSVWGPIGRDATTWGLLLLALLFHARWQAPESLSGQKGFA